jgi:ketosteroid isomerase-like protein
VEAADLRRLADEAAIRDLVRRYAHCVWQRDAAGAAALFAVDAVMDTGDRPPLVGHAAIHDEYTRVFAGSGFEPFLHNHVIDLQGDHATGTAYIELKAVVDGRAMEGRGFYEDEYTRTRAGWRFQRRRLHLVHYGEVGAAP